MTLKKRNIFVYTHMFTHCKNIKTILNFDLYRYTVPFLCVNVCPKNTYIYNTHTHVCVEKKFFFFFLMK